MTARASLTACHDVEPLLSPCVDGELLDDDRAAVRAHVAACADCRARLAMMEALKKAVAAAPRPELPAALAAQIRADVRSETRSGRLVTVGLGTAVVAAVVATAWMLPFASGAHDAHDVHGVHGGAPLPGVVTAVVERHRLDLPVDLASPDVRRVQEFVAGHVAGGLRVPRLESHGFGLQGARVVDVDEHRAAQLVYTGGYGQRLSVTAMPDPDGTVAASFTTPYVTSSPEGLAVRLLAKDGAVYAVVGDVDASNLEKVASEIER